MTILSVARAPRLRAPGENRLEALLPESCEHECCMHPQRLPMLTTVTIENRWSAKGSGQRSQAFLLAHLQRAWDLEAGLPEVHQFPQRVVQVTLHQLLALIAVDAQLSEEP